LVGTAPEFDLAVLQIDGPAPAVAVWGDSSELPLGSTVTAIGSALGEYRNSVTSGVLSGFNRRIPAGAWTACCKPTRPLTRVTVAAR
jgi:S1-C subfamily serine protease